MHGLVTLVHTLGLGGAITGHVSQGMCELSQGMCDVQYR